MRICIIVQLKAPRIKPGLFRFSFSYIKNVSNANKYIYVFEMYSESTDYSIKY